MSMQCLLISLQLRVVLILFSAGAYSAEVLVQAYAVFHGLFSKLQIYF